MIKKNYFILSVCILLAILLLGACEQEVEMCDKPPEKVLIRFNISPDPVRSTRAAGSVDDSIAESTAIEDLNVFIWNDVFSYHAYYTSVSTAAMQIVAGRYHIAAIGNAGKDLSETDVTTLHTTTLAKLGIDAYSNPVMTFIDEMNISAGTNIHLLLKRTFAYVAFNFTIVDSFQNCSLLSYRLHNVASSATLATPAAGTYTDPALCTATTEYYPVSGTEAFDKTYVFENCQPDVPSITDEEGRTRDNAPEAATYMELNCRHSDGRLFTLRLYLGVGSPASFTLRRNTRTQYNITIYSEKDARVTSTEAAYSPISQQIVAAGTGAGYYDLGTVSYSTTDARELEDCCVPGLDVGSQLESKGGVLQAFKGGAWVDIKSSEGVVIPASNVSGKVAEMKYRAYIPASYLSAISTLRQHMQARYLVDENQYQTLTTADATTRFGYKATVRSASSKATFTLAAENTATGWTDASEVEQNICIETAAAKKNAKYVVQGPAEIIKNFAGLYDDETGAAVGRVTSSTTTSVTGTFPVTKTGAYTLRFTTATITTAETNQNQTYMLNRNTITVHDTESHPTLDVTLECADGAGVFLRNAKYDSTEKVWNGTEESSKLVYTQATSLGSLSIPAVFVPLKSGAIAYTITVSDTKGAVLAEKTVTNTIALKRCRWDITCEDLNKYSYYEGDTEGWGSKGYKLGLNLRTYNPLDYVGKGIELNIPMTFDFRYEISIVSPTRGTYPYDTDDGMIYITCQTINDLQTTQTLFLKNREQTVEVFPIKGGFGNKYVDYGTYWRQLDWIDVQAGIYNWEYGINGNGQGMEAWVKAWEILLPNNPQLDLNIRKSSTAGFIGTIESSVP